MNQAIDLELVPSPQVDRRMDAVVERILVEAKTIADAFQILDHEFLDRRTLWNAAIEKFPPETQKVLRESLDKVEKQMNRRLRPWPKWAVNLAVEIFTVRWSTIPKETIKDGFFLIHFFFFEWRFDRSVPLPKHQFESFDPAILGAMVGHAIALPEQMQQMLDDYLNREILSPEKYKEFQKKISPDRPLTEITPALIKCLGKNPLFIVRFSEGLAKAKANTFDKKGNFKEPPLMRIYEKIFEEWPEVEGMSGVTELCRYLEPLLKEKDPDRRINRVKAIRRRLGIEFKIDGAKRTGT